MLWRAGSGLPTGANVQTDDDEDELYSGDEYREEAGDGEGEGDLDA